ncbi:hypothetical protein [Psychromonas sp. Urea-02u-13]|uniref:hypothetical protein n=1 Tax=Psychromonas sp. Urea-02u-13 TaxID=2058326 RepID=UPI000C33879A|nr:hypothetical protein [Psychromonas sp. Urea-02u-13]PKG40214.1 hypothetical protein CXF74_03845 [Psychromonas sp. Urea-02u-13]
MKKLILAIVVMSLTACSSTQRIPAKVTEHKTPKVNTKNSVSLGESMLESGRITTKKSFTLNSDTSTSDGADIVAGEYFLTGINGVDGMYSRTDGGVTVKSPVLGAPYMYPIYIDGKTGEVCFVGIFGISPCSSYKPVVTDKAIYSPDSFKQELIYTGKVGDKIRFTYREYSNGMARGAFSVDVEYDLSESNVIAYKGAVMSIQKATNTIINYTITKHFN